MIISSFAPSVCLHLQHQPATLPCIEKISPDVKVDTQVQLMHLFQANDARLHSAWVPNLSSLFTQSVFTNIKSDIKEALAYLRLTLH
jgi:hypothetical protein